MYTVCNNMNQTLLSRLGTKTLLAFLETTFKFHFTVFPLFSMGKLYPSLYNLSGPDKLDNALLLTSISDHMQTNQNLLSR